MHYHIPGRHSPRVLLALLALLIAVGSASFGAQAATPSAPQAVGPAAAITEIEPNNFISSATPLVLDGVGAVKSGSASGTIDSTNDASGGQGDWYRFTALGGATVGIS
nr:hypothetical protein [Chloroflexota bacterium]